MYYKKLKATLYFKNLDYFLKVEKKKAKKKKLFSTISKCTLNVCNWCVINNIINK